MEKQVILGHFKGDFTPFYSKFCGELERAGKEYKARCPFHDEKTPSLSIEPKTGLFHCFGCGASGDIFTFQSKIKNLNGDFSVVLRDIAADFGIFDHGKKPIGTVARKDIGRLTAERKRLVKTYDYLNRQGLVQYQKLRYEPKSFAIRRPDGRGRWIYNLDGVEPVLYNLPAVKDADEVWIVEGEKDADTLNTLGGFTATTNFDGAGKWRDDYTETLRGKRVFIIPDDDEPGRRHAEIVAAALSGNASSVRIVRLPNLQNVKGFDVSDFIEAVGDPDTAAERLSIMADSAAEWTPPDEPVMEVCASEPKNQPRLDPVAFPLPLMNGLAGEFAALYSQHLEPPAQFFYMSFLTCLGWAVSNRVSLDSEIKTPARLYTLLLGESADDRKSTAIDKTVDFFSETLEGFAVCRGVGSAEGLQKLFQEKPHLLLCFDEFKHFVSKCRIEASVLLPLVNTLFESHRFETHTKTVKISIENAGLSLLAASTTETYQQTWSQAFTDIGFNNRLFLVVGTGRRKFAFPKPVPDQDKFILRNELREVLHFVGTGRRLGITADAEARFQEWYLNREASVHTKRLDGYALRLMQLLAINDHKQAIDLETVDRVLSLCDWQLTARKLNDPIGADNVVARLENNIRRQLEVRGIMTEAGLRKWVHAETHGLYYFGCALANLEKARIVERFKRGQKDVFRMAAADEEAA